MAMKQMEKEKTKKSKKKATKKRKTSAKKKVTKKQIKEVQSKVKRKAKKGDFKSRVGRPRIYDTVEDLQDVINAYFDYCDENMEPYTITGLGLALGLSRQALLNYSNRPEFVDTINQAKTIVENYNEKKLYGSHTTGVQFNLTNNFNWRNSVSVDAKVGKLEDVLCQDEEDILAES